MSEQLETPQPVEIITELAKLEPRTLITRAGLAKMFQVTEDTIKNMVCRGELPPPVILAKRPTWMAGRILEFIDRQMEIVARKAQPVLRDEHRMGA